MCKEATCTLTDLKLENKRGGRIEEYLKIKACNILEKVHSL